ncbi:MAG TPA: Nif3-like dinuclear metal center hexameric protein [Mobilitalea sp.]|nr:Nif3-like dinuclear metal center hexameric protein [Mobilitalea sp.]
MKVGEIIDGIIEKTGIERISERETCDKLMAGSPEMDVTKIVTTFMATVDVIRQSINIGANFIITHEPTWYTGADDTGWLEGDPVYEEKKKLIDHNKIAIWRFHDHMHQAKEDGIYRGFDEQLGWKKYRKAFTDGDGFVNKFGFCYEIPETTLRELCGFFKRKMNMDVVQIVGNPDMKVRRVSALVGGGSLGAGISENLPMRVMREKSMDVIICGDITEWTLSAYVRDAAMLGFNKGMLVLGHERSEEAGMKYLPEWIKSVAGTTEVVFIDAEEPFMYL